MSEWSLAFYLQPEIIVSLASWMGVVVSFYTIQTFRLRKWKEATYFFLGAMVFFIVYKSLQAFSVTSFVPMFDIVLAELKVLFVVFMTFGVYKLKETARTVGA